MDAGLLYSVCAALVWGLFIFVLKRYFDGYPATVFIVVSNAFAILWALPVAVVSLGPETMTVFDSLTPMAVGVALTTDLALAGAFVLFFRALAVGDVSYVTPLNKLVPVFVLPIELLFLGEHLTPQQLVGVLVATTAVYVANYRKGSLLEPFRRAARSRPARLALLSAMLYAVSDVGKRVALSDLGIPPTLWVLWLWAGVLVLLLPSAVRVWPSGGVRDDVPKFAAVGLLIVVGEFVTSFAFQLVPASIASPIINTQAIVAVVLGGVILRERAFATRLVAAGLAVAGVALIAL